MELHFDSSKSEVFVANEGSGTVSVISDATNIVTASITVGSNPANVAFDSHLNEVFVSDYDSGSGNTVSVVSDTTNSVTATIIVGSAPYGLAFDSNKREVFVANNVSGTVSVVSG